MRSFVGDYRFRGITHRRVMRQEGSAGDDKTSLLIGRKLVSNDDDNNDNEDDVDIKEEGQQEHPMSLSEKLRQQELLEQQQEQQHVPTRRRERAGPITDIEHHSSNNYRSSQKALARIQTHHPPSSTAIIQEGNYPSSANSVDSGGWSWSSKSLIPATTNNIATLTTNTSSVYHHHHDDIDNTLKDNPRGKQPLYNKYFQRNSLHTNYGHNNIPLKMRILSAMHCTKKLSDNVVVDDEMQNYNDAQSPPPPPHHHHHPSSRGTVMTIQKKTWMLYYTIIATILLVLCCGGMIGLLHLVQRRHNSSTYYYLARGKKKISSSYYNHNRKDDDNQAAATAGTNIQEQYDPTRQQHTHDVSSSTSQNYDPSNSSQLMIMTTTDILLPYHISSHLLDIALPHYNDNNNNNNNNNVDCSIDNNSTSMSILPNKNKNNNHHHHHSTPYFWDVHFSGESVAEYIFSSCYQLIQACELGIRQPEYTDDKLEIFSFDGAQYVNVDTTTKEGIARAYDLGLAQSHLADVIVSPHFHYMTSHIFSSTNPGRMFALFRHPVDRAVSMYYYLSKATWDPLYNPNLSQMTLEQYAKSQYIENNWLTRFLVNKLGGKLNRNDVLLAKEIIKTKCLVGLYDDIEASMARFQRYFHWNVDDTDENKTKIAHCRSMAVQRGDQHDVVIGHPPLRLVKDYGTNNTESLSSTMPIVRPGSVAWNAIVRMNIFDMELYEFVEKVYQIQGEEIFDIVGYGLVVPPGAALRAVNAAENSLTNESPNNIDPFEASTETDDNPGKSMPF